VCGNATGIIKVIYKDKIHLLTLLLQSNLITRNSMKPLQKRTKHHSVLLQNWQSD